METLIAATSVGKLVAERPSRSRVFENWGLDYCCGGKRPLNEACAEAQIDLGDVLRDLETVEDDSSSLYDPDWTVAPLAKLVDHIVATHHGYLRAELPRLTELIRKVRGAHGARHPEIHELAAIFGEFRLEIETHAAKEEQILFPFLRALAMPAPLPEFVCGSVAHPIARMEQEHDDAGVALQKMRMLTHDYSAPEDACNTFLALLDGLRGLEADMHQHVHKENNILFPRALALEADRAPGA